MEQTVTWNLLSKRLSGEATNEELHQLEMILHDDQELNDSVQIVINFWNAKHIDNNDLQQAFEKHVQRMNDIRLNFSKVKFNTSNLA